MPTLLMPTSMRAGAVCSAVARTCFWMQRPAARFRAHETVFAPVRGRGDFRRDGRVSKSRQDEQ